MPRKKTIESSELNEESSENSKDLSLVDISKTPKKEKVEKKTNKKRKPENQKLSDAEFDKKVIELAKKGLTSEKIGETLRREGIHPQEHGKKISRILKKNEIYDDPELKNITKKLERITKHYAKSKQDKRAMREKDRIFSQLRNRKKYLKIKD